MASIKPSGLFALILAVALVGPLSVPVVVGTGGRTVSELTEQQRGAGTAQRGAGAAGGQRGRMGGGQRGRAGASGLGARIERRTYIFDETNVEMEYALFVSKKVDRTKAKKSPLVIALHGLGSTPMNWLPRFLVSNDAEDGGYIVAAPMGYNSEGWYGANGTGTFNGRRAQSGEFPKNLGELSEKDVFNVLALMREEFNVDDRRIYLAGQSMGGAGALFLGIKHNELWAAVAASAPAIRAGLHKPAELEAARHVPMILIHGDDDRLVPVEQSRAWAAKMKELNMTCEYIEIKGGGHGEAMSQGSPHMFKFFNKHIKLETTPR